MHRVINKVIFVTCICIAVVICYFCNRKIENNKNSNSSNQESNQINNEKAGLIKVIDKTRKLQMLEVDQTEIQDISMMICAEVSSSYRPGNDVTKLPNLKEVRHIYCKGEDYYYAVVKDNYGRKMFVFFREVWDDCFWFKWVLFMEKQLEFKDFNILEEGVSTKDDVREIDPGLDIGQSWGGKDTISGDVSLHMTKEGVVEILYQQKTKIKKINFHKDSLMKEINKCGDYE